MKWARFFRTLTAMGTIIAALSPHAADGEDALGFEVCNKTANQVRAAIGYNSGDTWKSRGWWTIPGGACEKLLGEKLANRFYYLHVGEVGGSGEWAGKVNMCTDEKDFTIDGVSDCDTRGFKKTGFFEVDTQNAPFWTTKIQ